MRKFPINSGFPEFILNFNGTIVLGMHSQADPDAVGSVLALTHWINKINPRLPVYVLEPSINLLGQQLLEKTAFQLNEIEKGNIKLPTLYILLDTSFIDPQLFNSKIHIAIFDHHVKMTINRKIDFDFRLESFYSTTEMITSLYRYTNIELSPEVIKGLLAGIIFDTKRLLLGDLNLFECVIFLLKDNPEIYADSIAALSSLRSQSEKIACIRAAQRMKRKTIENKIFLFSHVSSFEAAAARSLISLGGDVAVVIASRNTDTRISFRSTTDFVLETGISLGRDIVPELINKFGGTGGGHDGAAGYNNNEAIDIKRIKNFLCQIFEKKMIEAEQTVSVQ